MILQSFLHLLYIYLDNVALNKYYMLKQKIFNISYNLLIIVFVFIAYALLGFVDDLLKVRFKNNDGLSIPTKLFVQVLNVNI